MACTSTCLQDQPAGTSLASNKAHVPAAVYVNLAGCSNRSIHESHGRAPCATVADESVISVQVVAYLYLRRVP
eukprot:358613-Chlamydomonas_euryale.AAC.2